MNSPKNNNILGISAYYHDSAAALLATARSSRPLRKSASPARSTIRASPSTPFAYCLEEAGIGLADVDCVVFYDKPLVKFERLLETYLSYAPNGIRSFIAAMPVWLKEKLYLKSDAAASELAELAGCKPKRAAAAAVRRAPPVARGVGVLFQPVRARRRLVPRRRRRMGHDVGLASATARARSRSGRSTFRTRSACCTRRSRTSPASRSTPASTS